MEFDCDERGMKCEGEPMGQDFSTNGAHTIQRHSNIVQIFLQIQAAPTVPLTILYDKTIRLVAYQHHDLSGKTGLTSVRIQ